MHLVRHSAHFLSPSEALQRVFIPLSTLSFPFYRHHHRHRSNPLLPRLKVRHYNWRQGTATPTKHFRRRDEDIKERLVQIVSQGSDTLLPPESPRAILARIDRKADFLVEVAPATETQVAVCRVLPRRQVLEYEKSKSKKPRTKEKLMKQLEFNWAIGPNDLRHKLDRMKQFLDEGRRVELIIAKKRKGRDATKEERTKLLADIRAYSQGLEGVREWKAMIELGGVKPKAEDEEEDVQMKPRKLTTMLFFEGNKKPGSRTKGPVVDDDPATDKFNEHNDQPKNQPEDPAPAAPIRFTIQNSDQGY